MRKILGILFLISVVFGIPQACKAQFIQYVGTKDNIVVTRNIARDDSAHEFALTDTLKHPLRPGRMVSFLGQPYWWDGTRWYRLRGDTTTIPGQVNADWNATSGVALILNKPTLATVATTGNYNDLTGKPTITAQVNADWNAASGISQILNKPRTVDSIWRVLGKDSIFFTVRRANNTTFTYSIKDSTGGAGSGGTVTQVTSANLSPLFGVNVLNQTTTPAFSYTLTNAAANTVFGNMTGSTGPPSYSAITVAALPGSIPVSKTLLSATQGIVLTGNQLTADTTGTLATKYNLILKQDQLNGTGYLKQAANTSSYLTPTQVTADLNLFTTTLKGLVPAPTSVTGKVLSDNGTWVAQTGGGGGITTASGDASGTAVGTNLPLTLANVNANTFASNTLLKHTVNAKGLITSAIAANASDITTILGYVPFSPADTNTRLATKYDLTRLDTVLIIPSPSAGTAPIALYGRNDTLFGKRIINAIQNNDSSITVGNMVASNNLNDVSNKNAALNTLLPNQTGNATKVLSTDGTNTSWVTQSGSGGVTNITVAQSATADTIKSSTGTAGVLPLVNYNLAGAMSPGDKKRLDSTINLANTRVGDTLAYLTRTLDTVYFKGINQTTTGNTLIITKNHTQQALSYNTEINLAHANSWSALQTFNNATVTGTFTLSGTTYQGSNGKLDYLVQDTTTGITYRIPYVPIDTTGKANGYVLTWDNVNNKAVFASPGSGGTLTNFSAGALSPLFTTNVATSTTTPVLTFSLTNAGANTVFGSVAGGAPSYFNPSLTSSLFANEGTTNTLLHGNAAGNPSWTAVSLTSEVTGQLPTANGGVPSGGTTGQALIKNSGTNYDYAWTNTINTINGTTNQINVNTVAGVSTISTPQNIHTAATPTFASLTLGTGDLNFSRTDQQYAAITRPNTTGAKGINFSVVGGGLLDDININSANVHMTGNSLVAGTLSVTGPSNLTGKTTFGAATTVKSSFNIPVGVSPTSPNDGDGWNDGSHLYFRSGGVNIDLLAAGGGITSLNGLTNPTQTFATGGSGTDFNISSSGSTHTFNIPDAGNATRGVINAGAQSIYGTKTLVNAPILTTTSTIGDVWKATGTGGQGGWGLDNSIYNVDGTLPSGTRTVGGTSASRLTFGTISAGTQLGKIQMYSDTVNLQAGLFTLSGGSITYSNSFTAGKDGILYTLAQPSVNSTMTLDGAFNCPGRLIIIYNYNTGAQTWTLNSVSPIRFPDGTTLSALANGTSYMLMANSTLGWMVISKQ